MNKTLKILLHIVPILIIGATSNAQVVGEFYTDYRLSSMYVPLGARAFADEIVSFEPGAPKCDKIFNKPYYTLGPLDYKVEGVSSKSLSLGCYGTLIVKFTDNAIVNVPGPDFYIYEVDKYKEAVFVSVSEDGKNWIDIGEIEGGTSSVDITPFTEPNAIIRYVKLRDLGNQCGDQYPGADIDAIGSIGLMPLLEKFNDREVAYKDHMQTTENTATIQIWDDLIEDGDTISLWLNNEPILQNHPVTRKKHTITVELLEFDNNLTMHAENLGKQPPNTAAISIFLGTESQTYIMHSDMESSEAIKIIKR